MAGAATPGPPRIVIERTPANDVYLILDRLLPGDRVAALVRDPEAFLVEHAAELRFLRQALAARLGPTPAAASAARAGAGSATRAAPDPGAGGGPPGEELLAPGSSLLL